MCRAVLLRSQINVSLFLKSARGAEVLHCGAISPEWDFCQKRTLSVNSKQICANTLLSCLHSKNKKRLVLLLFWSCCFLSGTSLLVILKKHLPHTQDKETDEDNLWKIYWTDVNMTNLSWDKSWGYLQTRMLFISSCPQPPVTLVHFCGERILINIRGLSRVFGTQRAQRG